MDCIVVLGCKQWSDKINLELKARADKALERYREKTIFIASGGYTNGDKSESRYIKEYLISRGIPEKMVLEEDKSTNTMENALFTKELMENRGINCEKIILTTSCYHIRRAAFIFRNIMGRDITSVCSDYYRPDEQETLKFISDYIFIYNRINKQY